jgi:DNA-directed RNA polymerase subunit RPC12/RpoP
LQTRPVNMPPRIRYKCCECSKSYTSARNLHVHKRLHNGNAFKCEHCDMLFVNKPALVEHLNVHTGLPLLRLIHKFSTRIFIFKLEVSSYHSILTRRKHVSPVVVRTLVMSVPRRSRPIQLYTFIKCVYTPTGAITVVPSVRDCS